MYNNNFILQALKLKKTQSVDLDEQLNFEEEDELAYQKHMDDIKRDEVVREFKETDKKAKNDWIISYYDRSRL